VRLQLSPPHHHLKSQSKSKKSKKASSLSSEQKQEEGGDEEEEILDINFEVPPQAMKESGDSCCVLFTSQVDHLSTQTIFQATKVISLSFFDLISFIDSLIH